LKEHLHKFGLFVNQLAIIIVNKQGLHDQLVEAAEAVLARVEVASTGLEGLALIRIGIGVTHVRVKELLEVFLAIIDRASRTFVLILGLFLCFFVLLRFVGDVDYSHLRFRWRFFYSFDVNMLAI